MGTLQKCIIDIKQILLEARQRLIKQQPLL